MFFKLISRGLSHNATKIIGATSFSAGLVSVVFYNERTSLKTSNCDSLHKSKDNKVVIVGGGTAGVGVAAMLQREGIPHVTIIEPKSVHYYQPMWTLVGGGVKKNSQSVKPMKDIIPAGANWVQKKVSTFEPEKNTVTLDDGSSVEYNYLIVAAGLQTDWNAVPGLKEGLAQPGSGVCSIYDYNYSAKTWSEYNLIKDKSNSTMLFTFSPTVLKCAGAPMKIMWLLEDTLQRAGLRDKHNIQYWTPAKTMFGVPYYAQKLEKIRQERHVDGNFGYTLVNIDVANKLATFKNVETEKLTTKKYDFLHVAPHMSSPGFLKSSPLVDSTGFVDVDKETMQSTKYSNVFAIGDCANTPNSKTAAAITSQAPVLVHNLKKLIAGEPLDGKYNGYASCPLILGRAQVMLAEFGYGGKIMETFGWETGRFPYYLVGTESWLSRRFFYFLKEQFFPFVYWKMWVKGQWYGIHGPFKPSLDTLTGGEANKKKEPFAPGQSA